MMVHECSNCGEPVSLFAKSCAHCGAVNEGRLGAIAVAGALAFLLLAFVVAGVLVWRWPRIPAGSQVAPDTVQQLPATGSGGDFSWLTKAMQDCDAEATNKPGVLEFLVIPLASKSDDDKEWRAKSLNDIGNGILISSKDALDALTGGAVRIATARYVFRIRDENSAAIYEWKPSTGVAKFSATDADAISSFKVQFRKNDQAPDVWGNPFNRQTGTCYWVNAIIGN